MVFSGNIENIVLAGCLKVGLLPLRQGLKPDGSRHCFCGLIHESLPVKGRPVYVCSFIVQISLLRAFQATGHTVGRTDFKAGLIPRNVLALLSRFQVFVSVASGFGSMHYPDSGQFEV